MEGFVAVRDGSFWLSGLGLSIFFAEVPRPGSWERRENMWKPWPPGKSDLWSLIWVSSPIFSRNKWWKHITSQAQHPRDTAEAAARRRRTDALRKLKGIAFGVPFSWIMDLRALYRNYWSRCIYRLLLIYVHLIYAHAHMYIYIYVYAYIYIYVYAYIYIHT